MRPKLVPFSVSAALIFRSILPQFPCRFAAVAGVAQAFQIAPVGELVPVALVVHDVVHVRCPHPPAMLGADAAERLPQELRGPKVVGPLRRLVHPAPALGLLAAVRFPLGSVGVTVSTRYQDAAPWMLARPERLHCHGLSPPGKIKNSTASVHPLSGCSLAVELNSHALVNIQDNFFSAMLAKNLYA